jgi:hypothetical protein
MLLSGKIAMHYFKDAGHTASVSDARYLLCPDMIATRFASQARGGESYSDRRCRTSVQAGSQQGSIIQSEHRTLNVQHQTSNQDT